MAYAYRQIGGWFNFAGIYDRALSQVSGPAHFVEVGAFKGRSTCYMAERIMERALGAPPIRFTVIDPFGAYAGLPSLWPEFERNMRAAGVLDTLDVRREMSPGAAAAFVDGSLDFVFIDGNHKEHAVARDLAAWWPKLKDGALFAGHDYRNKKHPGVRVAVDRFVASRGLVLQQPGTSWMIVKRRRRMALKQNRGHTALGQDGRRNPLLGI